ncbi:MAG: aminotransferase class I/II-fold pyridoxal phosphate-dependent enzyme [Treponema sp.]|jgi:threonine-phosphate decarboxylase|nr:aminotransferase class I/II-fold pyridoxal phosphate-dependent enzyme [Treponema sp.]
MPVHGGDIYRFINSGGIQLDFSVNTNPLGIPAPVLEALKKQAADFALYPDPYCRTLRAALALYEGISEKDILCGAGASDLIYRLCLSCRPRRVLICAPTFSDYGLASQIAGAEVVSYRLSEQNNFRLTHTFLEKMSQDRTNKIDMVFLCNPNNPTGVLIDPVLLAEIVQECEKLAILLVVDECFLPFTKAASLVLSKMPKNLAVLKAFTKTFALAGLRFGYLISSNQGLLTMAARAGSCWNVSVPAQIAALGALGCRQHVQEANALIETERSFLSRGLRALGCTVFDSEVNFLLFKRDPAVALADALAEKGILIRSCENFHGLDRRYYRIGVKKHEANATLLAAIHEAVNPLKEVT